MKTKPGQLSVLLWVARVWSLLIAVVALMIVLVPGEEPGTSSPVPLAEFIALGAYGVAALGLLLAWLWEPVGAVITILGVIVHLRERAVALVLIVGGLAVEILMWVAMIIMIGGIV